MNSLTSMDAPLTCGTARQQQTRKYFANISKSIRSASRVSNWIILLQSSTLFICYMQSDKVYPLFAIFFDIVNNFIRLGFRNVLLNTPLNLALHIKNKYFHRYQKSSIYRQTVWCLYGHIWVIRLNVTYTISWMLGK